MHWHSLCLIYFNNLFTGSCLSQMDDNISGSSDQNLQGLPITQQSPNFSPFKKWSLIPATYTCPFHIFQTQTSLSITTANVLVQPTSSVIRSTAIETSITLFYSFPSTCKVICNCVRIHMDSRVHLRWSLITSLHDCPANCSLMVCVCC